MVRWEPGAAARLQQEAMTLFARRGYDAVTVAEIAAAAGVSERTFFRHYADKREVLFDGQESLLDAFLSGIADAPADAGTMASVAAALDAGCTFVEHNRGHAHARLRAGIIAGNPALQEREALKMASLTTALGAALATRGASATEAQLAAQVAISVFGVAFERWVSGPDAPRAGLLEIARETLTELRGITAT
jgi:AcrR family transcriptional regulator